MRTAAPWILYHVLALTACGGGARFMVSDPAYKPSRARFDPDLFVDARPPRDYRSVGVIMVPSGANAVRMAVDKGREVGCDLIVARAVHDLYHGTLLRVIPVAQTAGPGEFTQLPPQSTIGAGGRERQQSFVCGVYLAPPPE